MKVAIYSPYLDTVGGGEKYILTIAEVLSKQSEVDVLLDDHLASIGIDQILKKLTNLHNIDLSKVKFIKAPLGKGGNFLERFFFLKRYDWLFYLTDGSIFYATAKNNVLHFQVPFTNAPTSWWGNLKLSSWEMAIYNSNFTKSYVEKAWNINGQVIYPPVNVADLKPLKKQKQILSVGRFFGYLKDKKQEVLIETFKQLVEENKITGWRLHLVGAASSGDAEYLDELKRLAKGYPIYFHPNMERQKLIELFGESQIYWHAAGYAESDPKKFEHFGISIVEAMAAGCVPVIINLGGLKEIVEDEVSGSFWNNLAEFKAKTLALIKNSDKMKKMSSKAIVRSKVFDKQHFAEKIKAIINAA